MKKILFIDNSLFDIFHPKIGSEQRSNLLLQACSEYATVDLMKFHNGGIASNIENCTVVYDENIMDSYICKKINVLKWFFLGISKETFSPVNRAKVCAVNKVIKSNKYDFIVTRYLGTAVNAGLLRYSDRLIIDLDDNPVDSFKTYIKQQDFLGKLNWWGKMKARRKLNLMSKSYPRIIQGLNHAFVSNPEDCIYHNVQYLPNIPFYSSTGTFCKFADTEKQVLFVGFVSYWPNYQGISHFLDVIYPMIKQEDEDITITIVGKYDEVDISKWAGLPGVTFKGFVESLDDAYACSRAVIVPIYHGAGTNIKVLEAMKFCRPVVTTEFGSRGYGGVFDEGADYLVSKDDREFAHNVVLLANDEPMNNSMAYSSGQKVLALFSKEHFFRIISDVIGEVQ